MIIDVHAHYNDDRYDEDLDSLMKSFLDDDIYVINSATCPGDIDDAVMLANKYSNMFVTVGIHPEYALESNDTEIEELNSRLGSLESIISSKGEEINSLTATIDSNDSEIESLKIILSEST